MSLVIRCNYGDDSLALIEAVRQKKVQAPCFEEIYVVYIDTGWAAEAWLERVEKAQAWVKQCGFTPVRLKPRASFLELIKERKAFPSPKFQWCAGFLKGLPLIEWLDEVDPQAQWTIAIAKRQSLYRTPLEPLKKACPYHGERDVWYPILTLTDNERDQLLAEAGFSALYHRSLECQPCVNSKKAELAQMGAADRIKSQELEISLAKPLFPQWGALAKIIQSSSDNTENSPEKGKSRSTMDNFTMGCGDPFGCGL